MSGPGESLAVSAGASAYDPAAARLRRLAVRSWRRGMRENDLLLGRFADEALPAMGEDDLGLYEALLEENDQDLYAWIVAVSAGREAGPDRYRALLSRIAAAAAARLTTSPHDPARP